MAQPQYVRSGTLWYVGDGYIWDDLPANYRREDGRPLECSSKLFVYNPQSRTANVTARFYHIDRPPTAIQFTVEAGRIVTRELAILPGIPHKQSFWIVVESDIPVLPQARQEDFTFWDLVPDAMVAPSPYPGPLEDETSWIHPDCYQSSGKPWYEIETLTIFNPNPQPVTARVRWFLRSRDLGAEEEIEIPGERVAHVEVTQRYPRLLGSGKNGPPVRINGDNATRIDATGPIITESIRRARWQGQPSIVGSRGSIGVPLRGAAPSVWYYPGGDIVDRGVLPLEQNCDVTWNLLFTHNLSETETARATVTFHNEDGSSTQSDPLEIPPMKSDLEWLHLKPWLGKHTQVDRPFTMSITADKPVVPEVTCAEFEMWSQVCPGAMTSANFYPGPLTDERVWWLGIGQAGGADNVSVEWQQSYHLFNPGSQAARVTLTFLGLDSPITHSVTIPAGAVRVARSTDIAGIPLDRSFAVRAESDVPLCAQAFGRTFTRGLRPTRASYSLMGVPMKLE